MTATLLAWQSEVMASAIDIPGIVHRYCRFMGANGIPLCRATLALETLHPQIEALRYVWFDDTREPGPFPSPTLFHREVRHVDGCTIDAALMSYGSKDTPQLRRSPFWRLLQGEARLDYRLDPGTRHEFPVLDDLAAQGATHYVAYRLPNMHGQISFATRAAGGFAPASLDFLEASLRALAPPLTSALKELVLDTVLNCYVGASPAAEIRHGNIRPGAMLELHGAIWFSDIRGYSTLTQRIEPREFIARLNTYYECVVPIIYAHGGEVLKFIGDAVLAIFARDADAEDHAACSSAFAAARAATRALAERGIEFEHGIGLHVGRFQFGNIGSLRRMDFTVVGNEVNVAARIEAQCKEHGARLLMSEAFVERGRIAAREVARTALKGIEGDFGLFAPADAVQ